MYNFYYIDMIIREHPENVTFYGYRTATPKATLMRFDSETEDIEELEETLYDVTGATRDNHVLFAVKTEDCTLAIEFSDRKMTFGIGVNEKRW